ncbi:MAG: DinB family protein [Phycisphaerales bacterium]
MTTADTQSTSSDTLPSAFDSPRPRMREIKDLDAASLCARMRLGLELFDPRVVELSQEPVSQAWLEDAGVGVWPIRVLIGHLADAELVLSHRIRKILAEDNPELALWDEHAFIDGGIYGCTEGSTLLPPMGGDLAMIHTTRNWLCALLMQLEDDHWSRQGMHPINGPMTAREIANYNCYHLEHHAWYLNAKIEKLLGPAPMPEPCGDGGCGKSGCGCR